MTESWRVVASDCVDNEGINSKSIIAAIESLMYISNIYYT